MLLRESEKYYCLLVLKIYEKIYSNQKWTLVYIDWEIEIIDNLVSLIVSVPIPDVWYNLRYESWVCLTE